MAPFRQLALADWFSAEVIGDAKATGLQPCLLSEEKIETTTVLIRHGLLLRAPVLGIFYPPASRKIGNSIKALYAGKLSAAKGFLPAQAVSQLPLARSDFQLILAGSGSGYEYDEICPSGNCHLNQFTGSCQAVLGELMRECHLFIIPSFYEGVSLLQWKHWRPDSGGIQRTAGHAGMGWSRVGGGRNC